MTFWYWKRDRSMDCVNRRKLKNPEIVPHKYSLLIFDTKEKAIPGRKDSIILPTKGAGTTGRP